MMIQDHTYGTGPNLGGKSSLSLIHNGSLYSRIGASDNPGAVHCDTSLILEAGKAVVDFVAFFVLVSVVRDWNLAPFARGDTGRNTFVFKSFAIPISIIAPVSEHVFGFWQVFEKTPRAYIIAALSSRQKHPQGAAKRVSDGMEFGVHPALGTPDQAADPPF